MNRGLLNFLEEANIFFMWKTIQIAIQGRSHEISNTPCQDKTFALNNFDCYAVSLADGAGSAAHSEIGAQCVTKKFAKF